MFTTKQAAEILGYSCDAVIRRMIADKRIKAKKIGKMWIISKSEINRFKKKHDKTR